MCITEFIRCQNQKPKTMMCLRRSGFMLRKKSIPQARNCHAREMLSESFEENVKRKGVIRPEDALRF